MRILVAVCLIVATSLASAQAQERGKNPSPLDREISLGELQPTPEMWFYQQEIKRHDDPKLAVRRKAEYRAAQRAMRIESQKWYGYSAARPLASVTPFNSVYSAGWIGNVGDNFSWTPWGTTYIVLPRARAVPDVYYGIW